MNNHDVSQQNQLWNFFRAFFVAWKTNAEYALNGHNPAADWQVLRHVLNIWNRAHTNTQTAVMQPRDKGFMRTVLTGANGQGTGETDDLPQTAPVPYVSMLIEEYNQNFPDEAGGIGKPAGITINLGPVKVVPHVVKLGNLPGESTTSPAAKAALVVGGVAAGGLVAAALYGYATGKGLDWVFKKLKSLV
jgi:hypothetical protein